MKTKLLRKIRRQNRILFNNKTGKFRYVVGRREASVSYAIVYDYDSGWVSERRVFEHIRRKRIIQKAREYFHKVLFKKQRVRFKEITIIN